MKSYIKGGLIGGIVIYIWMAFSWMFLPWHVATLHRFKNEKIVAAVMTTHAPKSGIYLLPMEYTGKKNH